MAETNVQLVRRCLEAVAANDLDAVLEMLDPDVVVYPSSETLTGSIGPYRGHEGARRWFAQAAPDTRSIRYEPHEFLDFGQMVYVGGRRHVSGAEPEYGASLWHFRQGFIVRVQGYTDRDAALRDARDDTGD
jgi:ketosteroid isomerase-like protein